MSRQIPDENEPKVLQHRVLAGSRPDDQLRKAELSDIAASETLVLASAMAQAVIGGLEMKERRRARRVLLLIASGSVILIGIAGLAIQLIHS